jgi:hypothetical protein
MRGTRAWAAVVRLANEQLGHLPSASAEAGSALAQRENALLAIERMRRRGVAVRPFRPSVSMQLLPEACPPPPTHPAQPHPPPTTTSRAPTHTPHKHNKLPWGVHCATHYRIISCARFALVHHPAIHYTRTHTCLCARLALIPHTTSP